MNSRELMLCLLLLCCRGAQTSNRRREDRSSVSRSRFKSSDLIHPSVSARRSRQLRQKFHPHGVPSEQLHFGMLSRDEVIVKERGEAAELACEFNLEYYHAFDNPVIWLKSQMSEAKIKINSMAVIEEPFLGTRRYSVGWHKQPPRYWFTLTIKDLKVEDTGNYTCEIRGKKSSIIMDVVKTLIVRDHIRIVQLILRSHENSLPDDLPARPESSDHPLPAHEDSHPPTKLHREDRGTGIPLHAKEDRSTVVVTSMNHVENHLVKQDSTMPDQYEAIQDLPSHLQPKRENEINFFETDTSFVSSNFSSMWLGSPGKGSKNQKDLQTNVVVNSGDSSFFECLIIGGYPQPLVEIFIGGRNLTSNFQSHSTVKLLGDRGFKRLDLETSLRPRKFVTLSHEDHNQDLACKARSSHTSTFLAARLKLQINHKPVVTCMPISARIDDVNVCLRCEVIGRPAPAIFWTLDEHPVVMDTRNSGYWSLVRDKSDGMFETSLCIGRTVPDVFRTYDLVAENNFGRSSGRIDLILNVTRRSKDVFSNTFQDSTKQMLQQKLSMTEHDKPNSHNSTHWLSYKTSGDSATQPKLEKILWYSVIAGVRTVYDLKFRSFN